MSSKPQTHLLEKAAEQRCGNPPQEVTPMVGQAQLLWPGMNEKQTLFVESVAHRIEMMGGIKVSEEMLQSETDVQFNDDPNFC